MHKTTSPRYYSSFTKYHFSSTWKLWFLLLKKHQSSVIIMWWQRRAKAKKSKHSAHLLPGISAQPCPAELTLQAKVSTYLPQSTVCFLSPSPSICTPATSDGQMDPNNNRLDAVRTPQDSFTTEPHWPVFDPTGVPLKLGWKNKFSPAADPHILKL